MKKSLLIFLVALCGQTLVAQDSLGFARLKSLKGVIAPFNVVAKKDSLFLICFWSVNSEESIAELNNINANLEHWQATVPFRFLAVSVDEGKTGNKLRPTYNMNGWTFEVFLDLFGDLRRSLHSNNLPQSMILSRGEVRYQQSGWNAGSENYLLEKLVSVRNGR